MTAPIWALVTFTASGECLVDRTSLRASRAMDDRSDPSFGADDDDFDDELDDDDFGDETGDDFGDETGDELGDLDGDETGDDVGSEATRERKIRRLQNREGRLSAREEELEQKNRHLRRKLHNAKKGKIVQRNVTVTGLVATTVGQSMSMTLTPRTSLHLSKIFATGDSAATINTIISGDDPVVLDNLDAALIAPTAYHGPSFGGRVLRAGVPVTINYTAGSTTAALKLSFYGRARVKNPNC